MSIKRMTAIWDKPPVGGSALLVLLALADNANDEGVCWPSIATLAHKCVLSERQVQRMLRSLETRGLVRTEERKDEKGEHHSNVYTVLDVVTPVSPGGDIATPPGGDNGVTLNRNRTVIEPPSEHLNRAQTRTSPAPVADAAQDGEGETIPKSPGPPKEEQNKTRSAVFEHFKRKTGLCPPPVNGQPARWRKEMGMLWWTPLREICALAQWDERRAKKMIDDALAEMDGLTVSDPHSILKVCRAQAGKWSRRNAALDEEVERIKRDSLAWRLQSDARERRRKEYAERQKAAAGGN